MLELGLNIVLWLILFAGSMVITRGALHMSLLALGRIIKLLGYWPQFIKALSTVAKEKYSKKD